MAVLAFAIAFGTLIPPPSTAQAASSEKWLYLECQDRSVEEGDDFRLVVRKKYTGHDPAPYKPIRVYWYTDAGTADESDYEHLEHERQVSNSHQSRTGKMGRNFHTVEDDYPETDETYTVRFENSRSSGSDDQCEIVIKDDDGVGIYDLEMRSVPRELPSYIGGEGPIEAYTTGDVILITAHFTHPVTTVNPSTGEQADYAGLHLQIGENRRVANVVRGDGTDTIIFGYTVQPDDVDLNGISIEDGEDDKGFYYNEAAGNTGLWPVDSDDGGLNSLFHGLDDDPKHRVAQVDVGEPTLIPPTEPPLDDEPSIVEPEPVEPEPVEPEPLDPVPGPWSERPVNIESGRLTEVNGELTKEDEGRDWYSFDAIGGEDYFIEVVSTMDIRGNTPGEHFTTPYVDNHLIDPSILEIVDIQGTQVLEEHDDGGFISNWARAHFTPQRDGTYYIAVGSGAQIRDYLGFYTLSVRPDDYADDTYTVRYVTLHPGESITGCIDSDVSPDDPGLKPWDWWEASVGDFYPLRGLESLDDRDFFRFEIAEAGSYSLLVSDAPASVGIWATWHERGHIMEHSEPVPVESVIEHFEPGTYYVEIGTPWKSAGNTGLYTVSLIQVLEEEASADS